MPEGAPPQGGAHSVKGAHSGCTLQEGKPQRPAPVRWGKTLEIANPRHTIPNPQRQVRARRDTGTRNKDCKSLIRSSWAVEQVLTLEPGGGLKGRRRNMQGALGRMELPIHQPGVPQVPDVVGTQKMFSRHALHGRGAISRGFGGLRRTAARGPPGGRLAARGPSRKIVWLTRGCERSAEASTGYRP